VIARRSNAKERERVKESFEKPLMSETPGSYTLKAAG
jgi:hypothetical protein